MPTKDQIITALKTVKDPEVHLDIWTMGLIYNIDIQPEAVNILMTYTTPFCPWGPDLQEEIKSVLSDIGVKNLNLAVTFDPPYKMPDDLKAMLGL
jgi:ATP-binding protein involved in chromosome partitioning